MGFPQTLFIQRGVFLLVFSVSAVKSPRRHSNEVGLQTLGSDISDRYTDGFHNAKRNDIHLDFPTLTDLGRSHSEDCTTDLSFFSEGGFIFKAFSDDEAAYVHILS